MKTAYATYLLILFLLTFAPNNKVRKEQIPSVENIDKDLSLLMRDSLYIKHLKVTNWQDSLAIIKKRFTKKVRITEKRLKIIQ